MRRVGAYVLVAFVSTALQCAATGGMPGIATSGRSDVPECVTSGRPLAFPAERWDYAFYQMILDSGGLSHRALSRSVAAPPPRDSRKGSTMT
jgi:hypothetical protein